MYIVNGIAYAENQDTELEVKDVSILDNMRLLLEFNTGEKRLYDAKILLSYPAFKPLEDESVFRNVDIEEGVVVWNSGEIDIAPETMYKNSCSWTP